MSETCSPGEDQGAVWFPMLPLRFELFFGFWNIDILLDPSLSSLLESSWSRGACPEGGGREGAGSAKTEAEGAAGGYGGGQHEDGGMGTAWRAGLHGEGGLPGSRHTEPKKDQSP